MNCNFMLWTGSGYCLDGPFSVSSELLEKDNLEYAFELLAAKLIKEGQTAYYLTCEEYETLCKQVGYDYTAEPDDLEGWLYVDGTTEGAPYPIYIGIENLRAEFVN